MTSCRNDELDAAKQNIFDPANQSSFLVYKLAAYMEQILLALTLDHPINLRIFSVTRIELL